MTFLNSVELYLIKLGLRGVVIEHKEMRHTYHHRRYAANPKFDPNEDNATKLRSYPIFAFTFLPGTATRAK